MFGRGCTLGAMSASLLGGSELQVLLTLSELLTTVIVPPDPLSCGVRHERGICLRPDQPAGHENRWLTHNDTAEQGEFPWLVSVRGAPPSRSEYPQPLCTGVLVHQQAVLVSAACHEGATRADHKFNIRMAEYDINKEVDFGRPPLDVEIRRAVYHPEYQSETNDVAVLILEQPVRLTEEVNVLCLPQWNDALEGPTGLAADWEATECILHGWVDATLNPFPAPRFERVQFLSRSSCTTRQRQLGRLGPLHSLHESFVCATAEKRCWADGGSVLACRLRQDRSRWVLAGIRAWVRQANDCNEGELASYTNVGKFANWIRDTIAAELSVSG